LAPTAAFQIPVPYDYEDLQSKPSADLVEIQFCLDDIVREIQNAQATIAEIQVILIEYRKFLKAFVSIADLLA
jgi:hypothetical protein